MNQVKLQRLLEVAKRPTKATEGSAYSDVYSAVSKTLGLGETAMLSTGWKVEVPPGYFLDIRSRSGLSCKGIVVANAPGTVDEDFRGELMVILHNASRGDYDVKVGDRIAQCALMPMVPTSFTEVEVLSETARGLKGYGSSGR